MTVPACAENRIPPSHPFIQYVGRVDRSAPDRVLFDWPGVIIQAVFEGSGCAAYFEGEPAWFDLYLDGAPAGTLVTPRYKKLVPLARGLRDGRHLVRLMKRSESTSAPVAFGGFVLDSGKTLLKPPDPPSRAMVFIGDSYTAGFANEYQGTACDPAHADSIIVATTNTNRAFGPLVAAAFGAHYQVLAISGKGLVRNYNGIDKGRELPAYLDRTLLTSINNPGKPFTRWDYASWKADVAVIAIGINDFQADPPYADTTAFDLAYTRLITLLREKQPGIRIVCCATKVWPTNALEPRIKTIVDQERTAGRNDVSYFYFSSENTALYGHPSVADHRAIADSLMVHIANVTGWKKNVSGRGR